MMDTDEIIKQAKALRGRIRSYARDDEDAFRGAAAKAQVCEFLRTDAGSKSSFLKQADAVEAYSSYVVGTLQCVLDSFVEYLEAGLATGVSPERQGQLDVVSDILSQAHTLLDDDRQHPAAAAVLIGASLEEFLRTWVEADGLNIGNAKPGIDAYSKALRAADLIAKQDVKALLLGQAFAIMPLTVNGQKSRSVHEFASCLRA